MRGSSIRDINESLTPFFITCSSLWNSSEEPKYSPSKSTITVQESSPDGFHSPNKSDSKIQEQDSSSTLSTCQSHYGTADPARNNDSMQYIGLYHGSNETCGKHRAHFLCGSIDYGFGQVQLNFNKSTASKTHPYSESYFGGLVGSYGQSALIYPSMVGFTATRVPLPPLECAENIPILVNAKQFRAILRRRQVRANLEAHNKLVKSRKPYLHESRHLHALKRPRGVGGRFLNSKNLKQTQLSLPSHRKDISEKKLFGGATCSEAQHSDNVSWETTMPCASDVTSIFNGHGIFQQPEVRVPMTHSYPIGEDFTHLKVKNRLFLSIAGRAQK